MKTPEQIADQALAHGSLPLPFEPQPDSAGVLWMPSSEFGQFAGGIDDRNARKALAKCHAGGTWRGQALRVRMVESQGGKSGKAYQVYVPTLPPELRTAWLRAHPELTGAPALPQESLTQATPLDPRIAKTHEEWQWRLSLIAFALKFPKGTPGRGQALRDVAAKTHTRPDGQRVKVALRTLNLWVEKVEAGGEFALVRKIRSPENKPRHYITKEWDERCPLPDEAKARIAADFDAYVKGLWKEGVRSGDKCAALASAWLMEAARAAGWTDATLDGCTVKRNRVERFKSARISAIKNKDARCFADEYVPRIRRTREGLKPLDIVVGDVHPVDIVIERPDGSQATPRLIAWLDLATNDVFYSLVLLNPREGIKQAHIAASFVDMVQAWGLPRSLYLDNGSEYKWEAMINAFRELAMLTHAMDVFMMEHEKIAELVTDDEPAAPPEPSKAVTRAKPHNPPAKAVEGIFSALEKVLAMMPGYIGGDRMNKRTHAKGKAPRPFPGTWEEFEFAFTIALNFYRNAAQRGSLGGRSPRQTWDRHIADGFHAYRAPEDVLRWAFAEDVRPKVQTDGVEVGGRFYYHDVLLPLVGQRVSLRFPKWDPRHVIYIGDDRQPVFIPLAPVFQTFDSAGAIEQARRQSALNRYIRTQTADAAKVDLMEEMARFNRAHGPMPDVPKGAQIGLTPEMAAVIEAGKLAELPAPRRLASTEFVHPGTGEVLSILPKLAPEKPAAKEAEPDMWAALLKRDAEAREKEKSSKAPTLPDFDKQLIARYGSR